MKQLLFLFVIIFSANLHAQEFHTIKGEPFPEFEMRAVNSDMISNATLKGKPTLIVFFGTRCPPCMKELKALDKRIPDAWYDSFNIFAVGSTDDDEGLVIFNAKHNFKFRFIPDPNQELFDRIGDHTIPRTFLLDKKGVIISQTVGFYKTPFENLISRMEAMI